MFKGGKDLTFEKWVKEGLSKARPEMKESEIERTAKNVVEIIRGVSIILIITFIIGSGIIQNVIKLWVFSEEFSLNLTLEAVDTIVTIASAILGIWIIKRLYGPKLWHIIEKPPKS